MKAFAIAITLLLCGVCTERIAAQTPDYQADFMSADCNSFKGFALDNNNFQTLITVNFFENSTLIGSVVANRPTAFQGNTGPHGFEFPTPNNLRDGQVHTISARMEPVGTDMADSPRTIGPCGPIGSTIPNPRITSFEINGARNRRDDQTSLQVLLQPLTSGDTTTNPDLRLKVEIDHPERVQFYRLGEIACPESVSDRPEDRMKNLPWQPYTQGQSFSFRLSSTSQPYGTRCVFMQVNRSQNESSASAAKGDSIILAPASLKTFTLSGSDLKSFIDRAKALGYKFTVTDLRFEGESPCALGTVPTISSMSPVSVSSASIFELTRAKLFERNERFLNPFWKMTGISIHGGTGVSVTFNGPPSGRADDPFRTVGIKRGFSFNAGGGGINHDTAGSVNCVVGGSTPQPFDTGTIKSITLEGPDDKQPADAFFNPTQLNLRPIRIISRP